MQSRRVIRRNLRNRHRPLLRQSQQRALPFAADDQRNAEHAALVPRNIAGDLLHGVGVGHVKDLNLVACESVDGELLSCACPQLQRAVIGTEPVLIT